MELEEYNDVVRKITNLLRGITNFWGNNGGQGWARKDSIELLRKSRLDILYSMAEILPDYGDKTIFNNKGRLILAWVTLGSMVESTMKLFFSVWLDEYYDERERPSSPFVRNNKVSPPEQLTLDLLILFFSKRIWTKKVRQHWKNAGTTDWIKWLRKIQRNRNSIHFYKDRALDNGDEFHKTVEEYLEFLQMINDSFIYPDENFDRPSIHY